MSFTVFGDAKLSACGAHRFELVRAWNAVPKKISPFAIPGDCSPIPNLISTLAGKRTVFVVGLNPSDASATKNDPTIKKLICFAMKWHYDALLVGNLFSFRTPHPSILWAAPVRLFNPDNDVSLRRMANAATDTVLAWGNEAATDPVRVSNVLGLLSGPLKCIRKNAIGSGGVRQPAHPLYLPSSLTPIPYP